MSFSATQPLVYALYTVISVTYVTLSLIAVRLMFAAIPVSAVIYLLRRVRGRLSASTRSRCWLGCFAALLLPYERTITLFLGERYHDFFGSIQSDLTREFAAAMDSGVWKAEFLAAAAVVIAFQLLCVPWLAGCTVFAIRTGRDFKKTRRAMADGSFPLCASYFYKSRSHIYLPPDFDTAYSKDERAMLLAHEKQHIAQHDPLLYRLVIVMECLLWFCTPVHTAARLFQQDRELLCDARVTQGCSKRQYGMLLLKAAQRRAPGRAVAGIVSEPGGVPERIMAIAAPTSIGRRIAAAMIFITAALLALGLPGMKQVARKPDSKFAFVRPLIIYRAGDERLGIALIPHIEELEPYANVRADGVSFDQRGMYERALELGMKPEQVLRVMYTLSIRPHWLNCWTHSVGYEFSISELLSEDIYMPFAGIENRIFAWIYRLL